MHLCRYAVILYTFTDIWVDVGSFKTIAVFSWPSCLSYTAVCGETMLQYSDLFLVHITAAEVFLNNKSQGAQQCAFCFDAWSLIFFICPSGFLVQASWGNLKLCGVAVIDMCRHILWIAGFHWLRFCFFFGGGCTCFHCLSRLCLMKIFTSQPVLCHTMFVACRLVVHLLIFVTWCVAHGRRCWVEDTSVWLCRHFNDKPAYKLSDMLTHRGNVAVVWKLEFVQRTLQKKNPTWQSLGFWFWPLLLLISTYHAILSFRRPLQRLLAP